VAELDAQCDGGIYARTLPFDPQKVQLKEEDLAEVMKKFETLPGVTRIQEDFETYGNDGKWWAGEENLNTKVFAHKEQTYISVAAKAGLGCHEFYGEFWAIFKISDGLQLITDGEAPGSFFEPITVVDADLDGNAEFVSAHQIVRNVNGVWRVVTDLTPPNLDCGC
jgi:hypothetical protein